MAQSLNTLTLKNYKAVSGTNNLVKQNWLFPRNKNTVPEFGRSFEVALLKPNSLLTV